MIFKVLILFLCIFSPLAFALEKGECQAITESKVYLSDHFTIPYPRDVEFTCLYKCLGTGENFSHEVLGTSKVAVRNQSDDALKVVCQGIKLKKTPWGYDFDRLVPFYAYETRIKELRDWAEEFVSRDNLYEKENLNELKSKLDEVAFSYKLASDSDTITSNSFTLASALLIKVSETLPENTQLLDLLLKDAREGRDLLPEDHLANKLVSQLLINLAYWR
jgi:hypothetical protein